MNIIKDLRILKALETASGDDWYFDRHFKYNISKYTRHTVIYKNHTYKLKYFAGCFYPYVVKID